MSQFKYLSVCSGMEAATVAWHHMGWQPVGFSEIEPFPSAILKHHYPTIQNYGDLTQYKQWPIEPKTVNLLVGGTPCQSYSVAGKRAGLNDPRGQLMLSFLDLASTIKAKWVVWENVPGVLSSGQPKGSDFACFLQGLVERGYGVAYRVLDAQYFGVPQRRRRIFVVGCLGDWRAAAEVLSLAEGLSGYIEKGDKKRKGVATDAGEGTNAEGKLIAFRKSKRAQSVNDDETWVDDGKSNTLNNFDLGDTRTTHAVVYENHPNDSRVTGPHDVAPTVVSRFGTGGGNVPLVSNEPVTFQPGNLRRDAGADPSTEATTTLKATAGDQMPHIAYAFDGYNQTTSNISQTIRADKLDSDHIGSVFFPTMAVRRLTPKECERLQGFPDNWSQIPWKGKPAEQCPDGPRYKACGNSMAVPVMRWIGERIAIIDATLNK